MTLVSTLLNVIWYCLLKQERRKRNNQKINFLFIFPKTSENSVKLIKRKRERKGEILLKSFAIPAYQKDKVSKQIE